MTASRSPLTVSTKTRAGKPVLLTLHDIEDKPVLTIASSDASLDVLLGSHALKRLVKALQERL